MARLKEKYQKEIVPRLLKQFNYQNIWEVPRLKKIVVNMGVGEATANPKEIDAAAQELALISGQKASIRRAKKAIANFKLKENTPVGACVTLRRERMYEFFDRLVTIALPRVRDFRGLPRNAFDGRGNYSLGLAEQIIFPEIDLDKATVRGLNVTLVTTARTDREAEALLEEMGFPFRRIRPQQPVQAMAAS